MSIFHLTGNGAVGFHTPVLQARTQGACDQKSKLQMMRKLIWCITRANLRKEVYICSIFGVTIYILIVIASLLLSSNRIRYSNSLGHVKLSECSRISYIDLFYA